MTSGDMALFDLHCHLDLFPSPREAFEDCRTTKLTTVTVTTTPRAWAQNREWAKDNPYVLPALGLHPELVGSHGGEVDQLIELIRGVSIIGEIGLDGSSRYRASYQDQLRVFKAIVSASAREPGRVLSIHSRSAVKDVIEILQPHSRSLNPILHWFSGTAAQVKSALALGCYFSVNGSMVATESGKAVISATPLDRLLLESDAPFRKDVTGLDGRVRDLERTLQGLAALKRVDAAELRERVARTSMDLLQLR